MTHVPEYYIGIGASAGGLEALEQFFRKLPSSTGMAYIVVQHLSPDFKSLMDELLARYTKMPVLLAEDGMKVEADQKPIKLIGTVIDISDYKQNL